MEVFDLVTAPLPWECYRHVLSLGGGVQSSTVALMASEGLITPMPKMAFFADTQDERRKTYKWLEWLEPRLAFPIKRISAGKLSEEAARLRISKAGRKYHASSVPMFTKNDDGSVGMLRRHCTTEFKVKILNRHAKRVSEGKIVQWIGISVDEPERIKPSLDPRIRHRWPLIELGMSRNDCLEWLRSRGYPLAPRSSCKFCPYRSDDEWIELRDESPDEFEEACDFERRFAETFSQTADTRSQPFLHRSCIPLSEVKFIPGTGGRQFGNECEGMCGV